MIDVQTSSSPREPSLYARMCKIAKKCTSDEEFIERLDEDGLTKGALSWLFEDIKRSLEDERPAAAPASTTPPRQRAEFSPAAKEKKAAEEKAAVKAGLEKLVKTFFSLELKMPNGKKMGDCTGKELGQWGSQFFRLSRAIGPDQKLREVFSTDEKLKEFCL